MLCGFVLSWCFCGLCGLCTRVELGGYMTCGVFAFLFSPFVSVFTLLLCSLPALLWLSSCLVLFVFVSLWVFVFSFSLSDYTQKKGRAVLVRPLLSCCGFVYKSLNSTVISCGSSFPNRFPLQMMPATSSGRFVGSFTICPSLSIVEYLQ